MRVEGARGGYPPIQIPAFLSDSHRDTGWAKWLHARLERFRIDKDPIGRATPLGPVSKGCGRSFATMRTFRAATRGPTRPSRTETGSDAPKGYYCTSVQGSGHIRQCTCSRSPLWLPVLNAKEAARGAASL